MAQGCNIFAELFGTEKLINSINRDVNFFFAYCDLKIMSCCFVCWHMQCKRAATYITPNKAWSKVVYMESKEFSVFFCPTRDSLCNAVADICISVTSIDLQGIELFFKNVYSTENVLPKFFIYY